MRSYLVAEMESTFDYFTTLLPQSVMKMFQSHEDRESTKKTRKLCHGTENRNGAL